MDEYMLFEPDIFTINILKSSLSFDNTPILSSNIYLKPYNLKVSAFLNHFGLDYNISKIDTNPVKLYFELKKNIRYAIKDKLTLIKRNRKLNSKLLKICTKNNENEFNMEIEKINDQININNTKIVNILKKIDLLDKQKNKAQKLNIKKKTIIDKNRRKFYTIESIIKVILNNNMKF